MCAAKPCDADLVPQGAVYSPHLHVMMAFVLLISVFVFTMSYSLYRRYRVNILPIPSALLASIKSGDFANAHLFPKQEPTYDWTR